MAAPKIRGVYWLVMGKELVYKVNPPEAPAAVTVPEAGSCRERFSI